MGWKLDCDQSKNKYVSTEAKLLYNEGLMDLCLNQHKSNFFSCDHAKKRTEGTVLLQALWERNLVCLLFLEIKTTMEE